MLDLSPDQIDLWLVFDEDVPDDDRLFADYRKLLSPEEITQERRYRFAKHQRQYVITRALVRSVLSRYTATEPHRLRFVQNAHGRPALQPHDALTVVLPFNLSHTEGLVACAVADVRTIGFDVENVEHREVSLDIADRFFSKQEAVALRAVSSEYRRDAFFRYWTLKESYIKAKGEGLSIPLDQFWFTDPRAPNLAISFAPGFDDERDRWAFWLLRPSPEHIAALCVSPGNGARYTLVARRAVPLVSEVQFDCPILEQS